MDFQLPRGMRDIESEEYDVMETIRDAFIETSNLFNFRLMEPSPVEMLSTLEAKSGSSIRDEIYHFKDKGNRDLGLRFDLTIGLARYVSSRRDIPLPIRLGSFGSMFRYDEPQYGRYRWFYQWNAEVFGPSVVDADAEIIDLTSSLMKKLGLGDAIIRIGDRSIAEGYIREKLSEDNDTRVSEMLRSLDKMGKKSVEEITDEAVKKGISKEKLALLFDFAKVRGNSNDVLSKTNELGYAEGGDLRRLVEALEVRGVGNLEIDLGLVRGLDYYTGIVFEVFDGTDNRIGALAGGGRYDILTKILGRPEIGAVGVAGGVERTIIAMKGKNSEVSGKDRRPGLVYVAYANQKLKQEAIRLARELREGGIPASYDLVERNLKKQFQSASGMNAQVVVLVAPEEFSKGELILRNMVSGDEMRINKSSIRDTLIQTLK